jgi:ferredoxin
MRIHTDRDKCVGSGQCMMAAPDYFDLDDDGVVAVLREQVPDGEGGDVEEAVELCPAKVISIDGR